MWAVESSQLVGLAFIRHDWIRLNALAAARGQVLTPPEFAWHERAWLLIEAGDRDAAAALVASVPISPAAYRWRHTAMLTSDAELAAAVADRRRCTALYEQLLPMADEFAVVGAAVFTTGPVALQLGLLAAALGRWDDAARHLGHAVTRCDRLGARLHGDRARAELERLPTARARADGPVDRDRAERDPPRWRSLDPRLRWPGARSCGTPRACETWLSCSPHPARRWPRRIWSPEWRSRPRPSAADPVLDDRARAEYRARLADLDDELAEADARHDIERSARLAAERDALIDELARATGLGGRRRRLGDAAERARTTVTARIRDAIGRIERAHPELGRHLRASIVTGTRCAYRPAETVRWSVSQS